MVRLTCYLWFVVSLWSCLWRQLDWVSLTTIRITSIITATALRLWHLIIVMVCKVITLTHTHRQWCISRHVIVKVVRFIFITIIVIVVVVVVFDLITCTNTVVAIYEYLFILCTVVAARMMRRVLWGETWSAKHIGGWPKWLTAVCRCKTRTTLWIVCRIILAWVSLHALWVKLFLSFWQFIIQC